MNRRFHPDSVDSQSRFEKNRFNFEFGAASIPTPDLMRYTKNRFNFDFFRFTFSYFTRGDIHAVAGSGCPSIDWKVVNSGKRLRAYIGIDEGNLDRFNDLSTRSSNSPIQNEKLVQGVPSVDIGKFLSDVKKELATLEKSFNFGATLDLDLLGIEINDETLIPGLAVASSRAQPLAEFNGRLYECDMTAWMNGLEVCSIEADLARANLVDTYKKSGETTNEAEAWEAAKKTSGGLHFRAIQDSLDSDDCVGFWLLLDLPPSPV
ncbi:hypothetical protein LXL04_016822 [Taraxacum kok-saghyz]